MKNRKTYIPITLAELTNVTQSFSTSLEQIEYLAVNILGLQKKLKQNRTNENDDNELILEMIKFAENELKNLGGRPVTWLKYPLVTNVHDYNELKGRLKDDGKLLEWVKFQYNNIERSDQEHDGILGWRFNDRVLRQAELDSTEKDGDDDEGFSQLLWEALDLSDDFVDHLKRQLETASFPVHKSTSEAVPINRFENETFDSSEKEPISGKHKPHTAYVALEKKDGTKRGDAWSKLKRLASESKGENQIELSGFGKIYLKRDREKPEDLVRYKHTKFEKPDDGYLINKGAFNRSWDKA